MLARIVGMKGFTNMAGAKNFKWDDPLLLDEQLTTEERMVRDAAREYAQGKLAPRVVEAFRREHTDPRYFAKWARSGFSAQRSRRNSAAAVSIT
jgi:hypothetical protein